jgi:hypothetical protein
LTEIRTLIQDIYKVVGKEENWLTSDIATQFTSELTLKLQGSFTPQTRSSLRLSGMGPKCPSQLWHSIHTPLAAEPLPPWARIKYTYGHILEALVIAMAKAAGHEVTGEQDVVSVDGVVGHRDCVIDGNIVDVKSASSRAFQKFKDGSIASQDGFGYLDQLDGYIVGSLGDPLVTNKTSGFLLAIDKQLGHMCLYEHTAREESIRKRIRDYRDVIALDRAPGCTCEEVPDGKSGNYRLGTTASYNPFKYQCNPRIRTFLYSDGPRYLTRVVRQPDVREVDKNGKVVYNG